MKKALLGTTALLGVGTLAGGALASDGIKLDVGGFFRTAYQVNFDDNSRSNSDGSGADLGHDRAVDGVFSDAEIHFKGEITLENGLTAGARVELEGETAGDQIDEAYIYFSGGLGEVRIGSDDDAMQSMCVTPPGGTTNFGATSPNQIAANTGLRLISPDTNGTISSNSVCTGVDGGNSDSGHGTADAQKFVYFSPNFAGFQLGVSYTPNDGVERQTDGGGPHVGMPVESNNRARHNVSAYATYTYEGDGWGLTWGGGGGWEGHVEDGNDASGGSRKASDYYQTGLNLSFGGFKVGGAFEYYHDVAFALDAGGDRRSFDAWTAAGGASYNFDVWTVGLQYSHGRFEFLDTTADDTGHDTQDRVALTGNYDMAPGISMDAEIAYTWTGTSQDNNDAVNDYDSLELGIGTAFTF